MKLKVCNCVWTITKSKSNFFSHHQGFRIFGTSISKKIPKILSFTLEANSAVMSHAIPRFRILAHCVIGWNRKNKSFRQNVRISVLQLARSFLLPRRGKSDACCSCFCWCCAQVEKSTWRCLCFSLNSSWWCKDKRSSSIILKLLNHPIHETWHLAYCLDKIFLNSFALL